MNIFALPKKFYEMLRMRAENPNKFQKHPTAWFFSSEGKYAYDCANSLTERILYFQKYLESLPIKGEILPEDLYKIACIMADAMDYSGLCFAGYPNILMPEFNPLIRFLSQESKCYAPNHITAQSLLCALHGDATGTSYNNLLPLSESGTAMYLIEREIIWAFYEPSTESPKYSNKNGSPYHYSCVRGLSELLNSNSEKLDDLDG